MSYIIYNSVDWGVIADSAELTIQQHENKRKASNNQCWN